MSTAPLTNYAPSPVEVEKNNLQQLLKRPLSIPEYQRRYCWKQEQVSLLLEDIKSLLADDKGEPPLFLGTVILHREHNKANLVDGQQRCLTLVLLLKALGHSGQVALTELMQSEFPDSQSQKSLADNYRQIQTYLQTSAGSSWRDNLPILLDKMEFVVITISDIDQAFAFFDSQNTAGKRLSDFDLLKARHLRGIVSKPEVGIGCSHIWERYETQKVGNEQRLAYYLTEQILARTRMRQRGKQVDDLRLEREFAVHTEPNKNGKGDAKTVQLSPPTAVDFYSNWQVIYLPEESVRFPFKFSNELNLKNNQSIKIEVDDVLHLPLQINQPLLGGEQFFLYIAKYTELYRRYFPLDITDPEHNENAKSVLQRSEGEIPQHQRLLQLHRKVEQGQDAGYSRLIEIWLALVVFYLDRFGEDERFKDFVRLADHYVFSLRITEGSLQRRTVEKHFHDQRLFDFLLQCPSSKQAMTLIKNLSNKQADALQRKDEAWFDNVSKSNVVWQYMRVFSMPESDGAKIHAANDTLLASVLNKLKGRDGKK
ncbi:MAG TPA: DUF262 domain-containing protein [Methylobacter sp.]